MINIRIFGKNQIKMAYTIQHEFNHNVNIFFLFAFIVFLKTNQIYFPGYWLKSIYQNMIQRCEICKVTTARCTQFSVWFYCTSFLDFKKCRLKIIQIMITKVFYMVDLAKINSTWQDMKLKGEKGGTWKTTRQALHQFWFNAFIFI